MDERKVYVIKYKEDNSYDDYYCDRREDVIYCTFKDAVEHMKKTAQDYLCHDVILCEPDLRNDYVVAGQRILKARKEWYSS